jgi:predicted esterase YcpF (UPF0227 family)
MKQSLIALIGSALIYIINTHFVSYLGDGVVTKYAVYAAIAIVALTQIIRNNPAKIPKENFEGYLNSKKAELGNEKYLMFLNLKLANLMTEIAFRSQRGLANNTELQEVVDMLKKRIQDATPPKR